MTKCNLALTVMLAIAPATTVVAQVDADAIEKAFDKPAEFEFIETPFRDVMQFISKRHAPLELRLTEAAGVEEDTSVTMSLKGVSLRSAFNLMMDRLGCDYSVSKDGVVAIIALKPGAATRRTPSRLQREAQGRLAEAMKRKTLEVEFAETSLRDVVTSVVKTANLSVTLDYKALEANGISADTAITFAHKRLSVRQALAACCLPLSLQAIPRNEVIYITNRDDTLPQVTTEHMRNTLGKLGDVDLVDSLLSDALAKLQREKAPEVPFVLDVRKIEAARIETKQRVSLVESQISLKDILWRLLTPLKLEAIVVDDVLLITPSAPADN